MTVLYIGERLEDIERIYTDYSAAVYRLSVLILRDRYAAEDVTQDCFVRLMRQNGFNSEGHVKAWLLTVARNLCFGMLKRRNRSVPLNEHIPATESGRQVLEELYRLREDDRAAVYLFYYEGYASREIAEMWGATDAAVRARLKRARKNLKELLEDVDDE